MKDIWPYVGNYKKQLYIAYAFSIPLAAIKTYQTYIVKDIFDHGFSTTTEFKTVLFTAGVLFFSQLINHPIRLYHFYVIRLSCERLTAQIRDHLLRRIQSLPVAYFNKNKQGTMVSLSMNDTTVLSESLRHAIAVVREPLTGLGLLGVAFYQDWRLTLILIVTTPIFLAIFKYTGKKIRHYGALVQSKIGLMTQNISEVIFGQKIIKVFGLQEFSRARFHVSQNEYIEDQKKFFFYDENSHPMVETVGALAISLIVIYAHQRIASGALTTGQFLSFFAAIIMFNDSLKKFSQANVKLNQARAAKDRIFAFLHTPVEEDNGKISKRDFNDSIEIKNLTFSYGEGDVLKDVSLSIKKGMKVGLVGLSGSGKSTLVNLLQRLYNVEQGSISIDGVNIQDLPLVDLRSYFALVSQDVFLFNDTIETNLTCGHNIETRKVREALEISYASEFVDRLPDGMETVIGDRGVRLSGGQSQRLTIARAFLKDAPVFLFDEATSALDNESEKIVQKALERVAGNKTVIAVAHRLSTIQSYDKIVVFKEGRKVEEGTHAELMQIGGEYRKLYELSQS